MGVRQLVARHIAKAHVPRCSTTDDVPPKDDRRDAKTVPGCCLVVLLVMSARHRPADDHQVESSQLAHVEVIRGDKPGDAVTVGRKQLRITDIRRLSKPVSHVVRMRRAIRRVEAYESYVRGL